MVKRGGAIRERETLLLEVDPDPFAIATTNCGRKVESIGDRRAREPFSALERDCGVRHEDPFPRNTTCRAQDGRFRLIDFEFTTPSKNAASSSPEASVLMRP